MTVAYSDSGLCTSCGHEFDADADSYAATCPMCGVTRPVEECKHAYRGGCGGTVEWRVNPWTWKSWGAMCDSHHAKRIELEEETDRKYGTHSDISPRGFDPGDAGESWDED